MKKEVGLKKPVMHGMSVRYGKIMIVKAVTASAVGGYLFWEFVMNRRKRIYRNFYANYDIDKEFERMRSKNVFDSC